MDKHRLKQQMARVTAPALFQRGKSLNASNPELAFHMANCLRATSRHDDARRHYHQSLALDGCFRARTKQAVNDAVYAAKRTVAFLLAFCILSASIAFADTPDNTPVMDKADPSLEWVLLRVKTMPEQGAGAFVAPPPGAYVFKRGDIALLRAYDNDLRPLSVRWSGDVSAQGASLMLEMDAAKTIHVDFDNEVDSDVAPDAAGPWFDVPEDRAIYTFVGGGKLYGWFGAKRDKDMGAGITHLAHAAYPDLPLWRDISLNLEHIFTGAASDAHRSRYTPRTDPMKFQVASPSSITVRWPAKKSSWDMDCEMRYTFAEDDAIDIEFSATPRNDVFVLDYVAFMWASYIRRFAAPAIFFKGIDGNEKGWMQFGLADNANPAHGGAVARLDDAPLRLEADGDDMNVQAVEGISYTLPFYYGLIEPDPTRQSRKTPPKWVLPAALNTPVEDTLPTTGRALMAYVMLFEEDAPVRFALWNWGYPPEISAWDWQFVLAHPQKDKSHRFQTRLFYTPFKNENEILTRFRHWQETLQQSETRQQGQTRHVTPVQNAQHGPWPKLGHYWGPSNASLADDATATAAGTARAVGNISLAERLYRQAVTDEPDEIWRQIYLAEVLEARNQADEALEWYQRALRAAPETQYAAFNLDALFAARHNLEKRIAFWRDLRQLHPDASLPALRLGIALFEASKYEAAHDALASLARRVPDNKDAQLHLGRALLFLDNIEEGAACLRRAAAKDELTAHDAAAAAAARAEAATKAEDHGLAEQLYRLAVEWAPRDLWHRICLGETLEALGRHDEAVKAYQHVLRVEPESPYTASKLDDLFTKRDRQRERLEFWKELHQQHPQTPLPLFRLGLVLHEMKQTKEALATFKHILDSHPDHQEALMYAGWMKVLQGNVDKGLEMVASAAARDASFNPVAARIHGEAAALALIDAHYDAAIAHLEHARALATQDLSYSLRLAETLEAAGRHEEALEAYLHVVRQRPDALHSAGRADAILKATEDQDARINFWRRLAEEEPENGAAWLYFGKALASGDDMAGARAAWRRGREYAPENVDFQDLLDQLDAHAL